MWNVPVVVVVAGVLVPPGVVEEGAGEEGAAQAEAEAHDARVQLGVVGEDPRLGVLLADGSGAALAVLWPLLVLLALLAFVGHDGMRSLFTIQNDVASPQK